MSSFLVLLSSIFLDKSCPTNILPSIYANLSLSLVKYYKLLVLVILGKIGHSLRDKYALMGNKKPILLMMMRHILLAILGYRIVKIYWWRRMVEGYFGWLNRMVV